MGCLPLGSLCGACQSFAVNHEPGACAACRRVVPLKKGYCRLCWMQASLEAKGQVPVLEPFLRQIRHHQLRFAGLQRRGTRVPRCPAGKQGRRAGRPRRQPPRTRPVTGWIQLRLFEASRDYTRFDRRRHADFTSPWLAKVSLTKSFRVQAATLERLRVHRQLDEALAQGPDPLHLAAIFGLDPKTAIRYAENARQLLITAAEDQDPAGLPEGASANGGHAPGRRGTNARDGR